MILLNLKIWNVTIEHLFLFFKEGKTSKNFQKDGKLHDNTQHSTNIDYRPQGVCKKSSDIFW